eukprot:GFUD01011690.1.p1 GENE.GFUD01011690.1~~GFUD01011690.1.p1  ORF type:complete len:564 (-),score=129.59 GFUD01011690.1:150-1841(-)
MMFLTKAQTKLMEEILVGFTKFLVLLVSLYFFICSLSFLSTGFKIAGGKNIGVFFEKSDLLSNPVVAVMLGVLVTVLVQSSSTSTSILVGLVAAGAPVSRIIPMVLGANIGTSVTNTVVAITQMGDKDQFRRAFSCATVHDMFNWLSVIVFTTAECSTHFLETLTSYLVENMNFNSSMSNPDILKTITKPLINLIIQLDSKVLEAWAENNTEYSNVSTILKPGCSKQTCSYLLAYLGEESGILSDTYIGLILVIFSLVLMCSCLFSIVKILNSLIGGKVMDIIKKVVNSDLPYVPWLTGYVAMAVGAILTFLLQSSSVFTSTLTPLAGAGLVTLERAYPLTLGSNIGTTTTSILASLAADGERQKPALQIALVHLFFNLSGILVFYCIPFMRFPITMAAKLGNTTADHPWFAILYLVLMFFLLPITTFGLSLLGPLALYSVLAILVSVGLAISTLSLLQAYYPTYLPVTLLTWAFLPLPLRSLDPYDRLFSIMCGCCSRKQPNDEEIGIQEESHESTENLIYNSPIIKKSATVTYLAPSLPKDLESVMCQSLIMHNDLEDLES